MSNKVKELDIKTHTYYLYNDIINIKNFESKGCKSKAKKAKK